MFFFSFLKPFTVIGIVSLTPVVVLLVSLLTMSDIIKKLDLFKIIEQKRFTVICTSTEFLSLLLHDFEATCINTCVLFHSAAKNHTAAF